MASSFGVLHCGAAAAAEEGRDLQLEVYVNDAPAKLIGAFKQFPDKRMMSRRAELQDLGIKVPSQGPGDELIPLDRLNGVEFRFDEPAQRIYFTLGNEQRATKTFSLREQAASMPQARADYGTVLNYTLFAASLTSIGNSSFEFAGANATLDGRFFGPFGTLSQSGILGTTPSQGADALRLDTTWTYSSPESLMTYRAGDLISGGLTWTRPIRIGGAQVQRNFALRPDLVTIPLPNIGGTAAVPSAVDVYVNNVKVGTQDVPAGPFQLTNIPILTGASTASFIIRDASGRQIQTTLPFYSSPSLLKPGLVDFTVEAGLPRLNYGILSNSYVEQPVGSASARGGVFDWLTLEGHGEGGYGLYNGGIGAVIGLGPAGVLSVAGSGSSFNDAAGFQSYVAFDTKIMTLNIHASSLRTFGTFNDLASVTARDGFSLGPFLPSFSLPGFLANVRPPRALETVSVGVPLPFDASSLNFGYLHRELVDDTRSDILNVSYSRQLFSGAASMFITAFTDLSDRRNAGVFLGLSMPIGGPSSPIGSPTLSATASSTSAGANVTVEAVQTLKPEAGSYGWYVRDSEGANPFRSAGASYRSSFGQYEANVLQIGRSVGATVQAQGAIAGIDGGIFFSNRIDDAFAVVNAGAPGVNVFYENRPAGTTDGDGQLLIPNLRSYGRNKISIDPTNLPVDADAPRTQDISTPMDRSGIVVGFGVKTDVKAATVVFVGADGKFIPPGTRGKLEGKADAFVVGYDGRSYLKDVDAANTAVIELAGSECRATFPYEPKTGSRSVIGPVTCQ